MSSQSLPAGNLRLHVQLGTKHLLIHRFTVGDIPDLFSYAADQAVMAGDGETWHAPRRTLPQLHPSRWR